MDELLKASVGGMQKKLATELGTSGLELDFYFRENLICKTNNNNQTLRLGTGNLDFSLAILLTNPVTLEPICTFSGI